MAIPDRKKTLIQELTESRQELVGYGQALRHDLDFGAKVKRGVRENPAAWFGGAALLGLVLSRLSPARKKLVVKGPTFRGDQTKQAGKAALLLTVLKFGLDLAKPSLMAWIRDRALGSTAATRRPASRPV
jgi:hypothetical protein